MYPAPGEVGILRLKMYRGIKADQKRLHKDFASDPGDYGCGEYWTDSKEFAALYGDVISKMIEIDNVYHIPNEELLQLIEEYRTCKMMDGREKRRENSMRLTRMFREKGYAAVLTRGYESSAVIGVCIF
ncbi:MAG: hypothetical protein GY861_25625 [bacterium]|nr:hypothetical protein [bacterium]